LSAASSKISSPEITVPGTPITRLELEAEHIIDSTIDVSSNSNRGSISTGDIVEGLEERLGSLADSQSTTNSIIDGIAFSPRVSKSILDIQALRDVCDEEPSSEGHRTEAGSDQEIGNDLLPLRFPILQYQTPSVDDWSTQERERDVRSFAGSDSM